MSVITICSSASFYKQVVDIQLNLQKEGFTAIIPATAEKMKASGDFNVDHYKTWFADAKDYHKKAALMEGHFKEVDKADAILVLNYEKHGVESYIGGNVLMEMALAFHRGIPIFVFNEIPEESPFLEEIIGMGSIPLNGSLNKLISAIKDE